MTSIPERRPAERPAAKEEAAGGAAGKTGGLKVWRCRVCGYLCARESPPETCPVCKADRDRFEQFEFR